MSANLAYAIEVTLDAFLVLAEGRDDDELVFIDGALRSIAEHLNIVADWDEIEPVPAGEYRSRLRAAKEKLASGLPGAPKEREK